MEPAATVFLSYFDWATVLFVVALGGGVFKYLIQLRTKAENDRLAAQRQIDDERATRFLKQQERLESTVSELVKVFGDLKSWAALEFVRRDDHRQDIDRLRVDIASHAEHFQRELENHREECPARRT